MDLLNALKKWNVSIVKKWNGVDHNLYMICYVREDKVVNILRFKSCNRIDMVMVAVREVTGFDVKDNSFSLDIYSCLNCNRIELVAQLHNLLKSTTSNHNDRARICQRRKY